MDINEERIENAARNTEVLRPPKQTLSTFGITSIYYYLVTEPSYSAIAPETVETVVREGRVIAQRPRIVTPYYLTNLEGFSDDARAYLETLIKTLGPDAAGIFYTYKNEPKELNILSEDPMSVVNKLNEEIDKRGDPLSSIIRGEDDLWDVSLMKFVFEITRSSVQGNMMQMKTSGLLNADARGVPVDARVNIEEMFRQVASGELDPAELEKELERWGLFEEYQDRFLRLFHRRR